MVHTKEEVGEMPKHFRDNKWFYAKPCGSKSIQLINRIKAAFSVLIGCSFATEWR